MNMPTASTMMTARRISQQPPQQRWPWARPMRPAAATSALTRTSYLPTLGASSSSSSIARVAVFMGAFIAFREKLVLILIQSRCCEGIDDSIRGIPFVLCPWKRECKKQRSQTVIAQRPFMFIYLHCNARFYCCSFCCWSLYGTGTGYRNTGTIMRCDAGLSKTKTNAEYWVCPGIVLDFG
mmetsp:Transcript_35829/g.78484  ORF Transcript_35829/g.78484 Transcript_35829/m.78484 type:complete len:181 (-) Transcript_35829:361-903(-)